MDLPNVLELQDISLSESNQDILLNVNAVFPCSSSTAIIGPSGGGKSTLLKIACGLIIPSSGKVLYNGVNIARFDNAKERAFRLASAFVFQDAALWANQSLRASLELPLKIHYPKMSAEERSERVASVVKDVGYRRSLDIRPSELSAGEQKLIAFARSMVLNPQLIFLDEWTDSLDETSSARLQRLVLRKRNAGATVIFISHNRSVIEKSAQRVYIVSDGTCSDVLDISELKNRFETDASVKEGIGR